MKIVANSKILINIPKIYGGVYDHYWGLYPYWSEDVYYNPIGRRSWRKWSGLLWFPWDLIRFSLIILFKRPDIVIINPSFTFSAITRDALFLKISLFFQKKTVVFIHGWHKNEERKMKKEKIKKLFNKTSAVIVLAEEFKSSLLKIGITTPIYITSTKVNDNLLNGFQIEKRMGDVNTILFLARIEKEKGIFILVDTFIILKKKYPRLKLRIVGSGTVLSEIMEYVKVSKVKDVYFTGRLSGEQISKEFTEADLYILPTTHGEGMPASVLEAMAFGLPVITRPVGGLVDFFTNQMGSLLESLEPKNYAEEIEKYIQSPELTKKVSIFNFFFAKENFLASSVAKKIEDIVKL